MFTPASAPVLTTLVTFQTPSKDFAVGAGSASADCPDTVQTGAAEIAKTPTTETTDFMGLPPNRLEHAPKKAAQSTPHPKQTGAVALTEGRRAADTYPRGQWLR